MRMLTRLPAGLLSVFVATATVHAQPEETAPAGDASTECAAEITDRNARCDDEAADTSAIEERGAASVAIAENTQGAFLLRKLLLDRQYRLFGRAEGDAAAYRVPALDSDGGFELRRLRVGIAGLNPWFDNVSYKFEFDLTDGSSSISSAYLAVDLGARGVVTLGNQDGSQSLAASTGSLSQLFMESPLPIEAFGIDKRVGVSWDRFTPRSGVHLLLFGRDLNSDAKHSGLAARGFWVPYRAGDAVWHLGASILREDISGDTRLRSRPESHVTGMRLVDTGAFSDVRSDHRLGLEIAGAKGPFTTRLEIMRNNWVRDDASRNRFRGGYLEGGYFFGGIPFRYRDGKFVRPTLSPGTVGWELAYRLSWLDLDDGDVRGGSQRNAGLALNVYPRPDLRGQFNLIHVNSDVAGGDGWLLQGRLQFNW